MHCTQSEICIAITRLNRKLYKYLTTFAKKYVNIILKYLLYVDDIVIKKCQWNPTTNFSIRSGHLFKCFETEEIPQSHIPTSFEGGDCQHEQTSVPCLLECKPKIRRFQKFSSLSGVTDCDHTFWSCSGWQLVYAFVCSWYKVIYLSLYNTELHNKMEVCKQLNATKPTEHIKSFWYRNIPLSIPSNLWHYVCCGRHLHIKSSTSGKPCQSALTAPTADASSKPQPTFAFRPPSLCGSGLNLHSVTQWLQCQGAPKEWCWHRTGVGLAGGGSETP